MINKLKDQKLQKRFLIIALVFTTSLAIASTVSLLTRVFSTNVSHVPVMEMELIQTAVTGEIVPGETLAIAPVIQNVGTKECLAFVKVTVPTYGSSSSPAYTYTIDEENWTKVGGSCGTAVYGYKDVLGNNDVTTAPMEGITLKDIPVPDFLSIPDLNITTGYLAETAEYGSDPQTAWSRIGE